MAKKEITLSDIFEKIHDHTGQISVEDLFRELPPPEAAALMGVTTRYLEDGRKNGTGPKFIKRGNNLVRYRIYDLVKDQEARLARSNAEAMEKADRRGAA